LFRRQCTSKPAPPHLFPDIYPRRPPNQDLSPKFQRLFFVKSLPPGGGGSGLQAKLAPYHLFTAQTCHPGHLEVNPWRAQAILVEALAGVCFIPPTPTYNPSLCMTMAELRSLACYGWGGLACFYRFELFFAFFAPMFSDIVYFFFFKDLRSDAALEGE